MLACFPFIKIKGMFIFFSLLIRKEIHSGLKKEFNLHRNVRHLGRGSWTRLKAQEPSPHIHKVLQE